MKSNKNIKNIIIALLFATIVVPLVFSESFFFPFISAKGFTFRILIEITFALYIILVIRDRSFLPKKSFIIWSVLSFLVVMAIATVNSIYPYKSFWSNYERMEGYITLLHLGAYFVMLCTILNTRKIWNIFLNSSLVMSLIMGVKAFIDAGDNVSRIYGTLGNSSYLGVYALVHIFIAGYFLVHIMEQGKNHDVAFGRKVFFYSSVGFFNLLVMYFTGTRGSFVGLLAGGIVVALILALFEKEKKYIRNIGIAGIVIILLAVVSLSALNGSQFSKNNPKLSIDRYASLITFDLKKVLQDQGYGRTLLWGVAWEGVKERPIFGWGQESFNYVFAKHYNPEMYGQEQWFDRAHNVFLDWLVAGGIVGLLSYLVMFLAFLWCILRLPEDRMGRGEKAILAGLVTAYSVHNLFVFDNLVSYLLFFSLLAYVQMLTTVSTQTKNNIKNHHSRPLISGVNFQYASMAVVSVLMLFVIYTASIKPIMANTTLIDSLISQAAYSDKNSGRAGEKSTLQSALDGYKKALAYNTFGTGEVREQLSLAAQNVFVADPDISKEALILSYKETIKQTIETPQDPRHFYFLATLSARTGNYEKTLEPIRRAEALSPKKQSFLFMEGEVLVNLKKYDEALAVFKKAYDLAPSYDQAQILYAIGSLYANKTSEAVSVIEKNPKILSDQRLLQSLVLTKKVGNIVPVLEGAIKDSRGNLQTYVFLAEAYLQTGQRVKALTTLQGLKALVNDKESLSQIDKLIQKVNKGENSLVE